MAYICNRKTPCSQCEHYKFDKEENQMAWQTGAIIPCVFVPLTRVLSI